MTETMCDRGGDDEAAGDGGDGEGEEDHEDEVDEADELEELARGGHDLVPGHGDEEGPALLGPAQVGHEEGAAPGLGVEGAALQLQRRAEAGQAEGLEGEGPLPPGGELARDHLAAGAEDGDLAALGQIELLEEAAQVVEEDVQAEDADEAPVGPAHGQDAGDADVVHARVAVGRRGGEAFRLEGGAVPGALAGVVARGEARYVVDEAGADAPFVHRAVGRAEVDGPEVAAPREDGRHEELPHPLGVGGEHGLRPGEARREGAHLVEEVVEPGVGLAEHQLRQLPGPAQGVVLEEAATGQDGRGADEDHAQADEEDEGLDDAPGGSGRHGDSPRGRPAPGLARGGAASRL